MKKYHFMLKLIQTEKLVTFSEFIKVPANETATFPFFDRASQKNNLSAMAMST